MKVRLLDNDPCQFLVTSESDGGKSYVVDLCAYPIGLDAEGNMDFNGACISTRTDEEYTMYGCKDFTYRCQPALNRAENMGKTFRCKHVSSAREYAFKLLLPYMAKNRPNQEH